MFCMYNNGRRLDVKSVSVNTLLKYGVCSYTDGQVYGYTLNTDSDIQLPVLLYIYIYIYIYIYMLYPQAQLDSWS